MKKNVFVWLLGFFAAITICLKSGTSVRAFAATNYYLEVSVLSASEAATLDPSGTVHGGDYKVSFCVDVDPNAQRPRGFGLTFTYNNTYFAPLHDGSAPYNALFKKPSSQTGIWDTISAGVDETQQLLSLVISSASVINFSNGEIVCMFLRPTATPVPSNIGIVNNLSIRQMSNENKQEMNPTEYTPYHQTYCQFSFHDVHFIVGDLNNNGVVDLNDHVYFLDILQSHTSYTYDGVSAYLTISDVPGLFTNDPIIGQQIIFKVGDVNNDGVINQQDANLVFQYYENDLLSLLTGNEYIGSEWIARFKITAGNEAYPELYQVIPA